MQCSASLSTWCLILGFEFNVVKKTVLNIINIVLKPFPGIYIEIAQEPGLLDSFNTKIAAV